MKVVSDSRMCLGCVSLLIGEVELVRKLIANARIARAKKDQLVVETTVSTPVMVNALNRGIGPREYVKRLRLDTQTWSEKEKWLGAAYQNAILGGCRKTLPSVRSGIMCYVAFASME
jgi:hypothetical protein